MNNDAALTQIAENFRFYGDMRFKQLTLFMAAMSAVTAGVLQYPNARWWIALGGLFIAGIMWIVEVRATLNAIAAHDAIPEVFPKQVGRFWPWLNSSWAVLFMHIACYVLWLSCIRIWYPASISFYFGAAVGLLLLVFSTVSYGRRSKFWLGPR